MLRGPQGTAFGKNTIGGAVNMVTIRPSSTTPRGTLELATGNYDLKQVRGFYGGPISGDTVSRQLTLGVRQRDGWFENRTEGLDDLMCEDHVGAAEETAFHSDGMVDIEVSVGLRRPTRMSTTGRTSLPGPLFPVDGMDGFDRSIATNPGDFYKRDMLGASVRGNFTFGGLMFTSLTAYRYIESENFNDQDYSELDILGTGRRDDLDFLSQEFRLSSIAGNDFSYLAGLFFSDRTTDGLDRAKLGEFVPVLFGIGAIPGYQEWVFVPTTIEEQTWAAFFSGSWAFSERGTLEFGLRYTSEDKTLDYSQSVEPFYVAPGVPVGIAYALAVDIAPIHQERSDSDPSGDLNLVYRLSQDVNGYFRYARGFRAGGYATIISAVPDPGDLEFDSEKVDAFELGIKSLLADSKVRFNAAVYYMDYQDKQEQYFDGVQFHSTNAARVTSKGFDLELKWLPVSGLEILATGGYADATYDEFLLGDADLSGNRLAPKWTGSLAIQYYNPFANTMGWFIRGAAYHVGDTPTDKTTKDPRWRSGGDTGSTHGRVWTSRAAGTPSLSGEESQRRDLRHGRMRVGLTGTTYQARQPAEDVRHRVPDQAITPVRTG